MPYQEPDTVAHYTDSYPVVYCWSYTGRLGRRWLNQGSSCDTSLDGFDNRIVQNTKKN